MVNERIPLIYLSGGPRERGHLHGEILRADIHKTYENLMEMVDASIKDNQEYQEEQFRGKLNAYLEQIKAHILSDAPEVYEELVGISEGANLDFWKILTLNCVPEVRRLMWPQVAANVFGPDSSPADSINHGCTLFAALEQATRDKNILIGQTQDIEPSWELVIFHLEKTGTAPEQLILGYPGIIGECGINTAGLAFAASGILVSDQRAGLPAPLICRKILEQKRLSAAAGAVVNARRTIGIHYLIAAPFGVIDLETSAARHSINYIAAPVTTCSNHFLSPELKPLQLGYFSMDTILRKGRMQELLDKDCGELDIPIIKQALSDHADYPTGICRHAVDGTSTSESRCAVILQPNNGLMLASNGPPCQNDFQEFRIDIKIPTN